MALLARLVGLGLVLAGVATGQPQRVVLPVTADVGITSVRGKQRMSNALGPSTEIRQNQNWSGFEAKTLLMTFETEPIRGWTVKQAWLNLVVASQELVVGGSQPGRDGRWLEPT